MKKNLVLGTLTLINLAAYLAPEERVPRDIKTVAMVIIFCTICIVVCLPDAATRPPPAVTPAPSREPRA